MDENELKLLWSLSSTTQSVTIDEGQLLQSISKQVAMMERKVRKRDFREISVAVVMMFFFSGVLLRIPAVIGKVGATIIVLNCMVVIYKLLRARVKITTDNTQNALTYLDSSLKGIQKQIKLLNTVLWWYILPFGIGVLCVYCSSGHSPQNKVIYSLAVVMICSFTYYLNRRAVTRNLRPLEEQLKKLIKDLTI